MKNIPVIAVLLLSAMSPAFQSQDFSISGRCKRPLAI
jgi:hypothetical protein